MHYITTESFMLCLPLVSNAKKVPFLWSLRKNWIRSCGFCANGYRSTSVAVVERRRFYRNGRRYRFQQPGEAETSGVSNCLWIMLQPERSSGSKKDSILLCFFFYFNSSSFYPSSVLFCLVFVLFFFTHVAVSCNGTCMLMILFLCFNHDVPILVPACCCSPNVTSALSKLQFCCTHLKKKTNNNNAVKKVSCG